MRNKYTRYKRIKGSKGLSHGLFNFFLHFRKIMNNHLNAREKPLVLNNHLKVNNFKPMNHGVSVFVNKR